MKKLICLFLAIAMLFLVSCAGETNSSVSENPDNLPNDEPNNPPNDEPDNPPNDEPDNPPGDEPDNPDEPLFPDEPHFLCTDKNNNGKCDECGKDQAELERYYLEIDKNNPMYSEKSYKKVFLFYRIKELPFHGYDVKHEEHNCEVLPFTALLKGFGAEVEWINEKTAMVTYEERRFCLYTDADFFDELDEGENPFDEVDVFYENLFHYPCGGEYYIPVMEKSGNEYYVECCMTEGLLLELGLIYRYNTSLDGRDDLIYFYDR